jgi:hypothetical protein
MAELLAELMADLSFLAPIPCCSLVLPWFLLAATDNQKYLLL